MEVLNNLALFLLQTEISRQENYLMTKNYKKIEYKLNDEMEEDLQRFTICQKC